MSVLTKNEILKELREGKDGDGLVVTPLCIESIGASSIDMCLGHEFIIFRKASVASFDVKAKSPMYKNIHRYQEKVRISNFKQFILHPGQLVLGATDEYIALPDDIAATITGRSTWGRMGLMIATATQIAPSYKGCITLELVNEGEVPIVLYPRLPVAQLVLFRTEGKVISKGRYQFQTGPEFPKFNKERDSSESAEAD